MSTIQKITLIGFYNYDNTLFDNLTLPEGYDKETFIDSLILEHGEKCVLYSNFEYLKSAIGVWGQKWYLELSRIYEALTAQYNPIYNYDRYENIEVEHDKDRTDNLTGGHTSKNEPDFDITSEQITGGETEQLISADNSSTYQPERLTKNDIGKVKEHTEGTSENRTEKTNSKLTSEETANDTTTAHMYGNIGVTTAASMVTEVVEQRMKYNLYGAATRLFANELLINIY